jgi:hypothetical protein
MIDIMLIDSLQSTYESTFNLSKFFIKNLPRNEYLAEFTRT